LAVLVIGEKSTSAAPQLVKALPMYSPAAPSVQKQVGVNLRRFAQFWELMDAIHIHGYTRAAMSVVGRSTIGAWWDIRKHPDFGKYANNKQRKQGM
jgi:hypothetical protein